MRTQNTLTPVLGPSVPPGRSVGASSLSASSSTSSPDFFFLLLLLLFLLWPFSARLAAFFSVASALLGFHYRRATK